MEAWHLMDGSARRCTAKSKQSGRPCKRRSIPGGSFCTMHGGKAPQVQASAKERIARWSTPRSMCCNGRCDTRTSARRCARLRICSIGRDSRRKAIELSHEAPTLEVLLAASHSPVFDERERVGRLSVAAIQRECAAAHGGVCASVMSTRNGWSRIVSPSRAPADDARRIRIVTGVPQPERR